MKKHKIDIFPHCDSRILHAPNSCEFCDKHPDWQALRIAWGVCFTGEIPELTEPAWKRKRLVPCPSEIARPLEVINKWEGNIPQHNQELTSGKPVPLDKSHTALKSNGQQEDYIVLTKEERSKGFVRPVRTTYTHLTCNTNTTMSREIAETYARDPKFYTGTFCVYCRMHFPLDQFVWNNTNEQVGS